MLLLPRGAALKAERSSKYKGSEQVGAYYGQGTEGRAVWLEVHDRSRVEKKEI